jgi:hypothetical protein
LRGRGAQQDGSCGLLRGFLPSFATRALIRRKPDHRGLPPQLLMRDSDLKTPEYTVWKLTCAAKAT